jgi:peptidoglycan hydrolase CwlO-like protein
MDQHRLASRLPAALAALVLCFALSAWLATARTADGAQSEGSLRNRIDTGKSRERALSGAAAHLGRLERATAREVALLERRLASAQSDLDAAVALEQRTAQRLDAAQARVARLRARLAQVRGKLASVLRERYMGTRPDLVLVVLSSHGFTDLLETVEFLHRIQDSDTQLLGIVRGARRDAGKQQRVLTVLSRQRAAAADAVRSRRNALAAITAGLRARQAAFAQARAARLAALQNTRAGRLRAQRVLSRLLAERARAARQTGPGGPWAIPWPVVQCESGGQNLPPNSATASGYYQMLDTTWAGLGGSTKHAYQASKAEQDRLAANLWNGGAGASNWVCASLVGIV